MILLEKFREKSLIEGLGILSEKSKAIFNEFLILIVSLAMVTLSISFTLSVLIKFPLI